MQVSIDQITKAHRDADLEAMGRYGVAGKGPKYHILLDEADQLEKQLVKDNMLQLCATANDASTDLQEFLQSSSPSSIVLQQEYEHLTSHLNDVIRVANALTNKNGQTALVPPTVMPWDEYNRMIPSIPDLAEISPVAVALAVLMDLFTVFLTFWLEAVPYGRVNPEESDIAVEELMGFMDWRVNHNNAFEFRLGKSEAERSAGVNVGRRLFWAATLLSRGFLRRVDNTTAEFTPRLYRIFSDYFFRRGNER